MDAATLELLNPSTPFNGSKLRTLEQHINNIYSSDAALVAQSDAVLTQLKQQDGLLLSIQPILEHATLDRTKFYMLVVFEQRLASIWPLLAAEQRQSLRQYVVQLFLKFARTTLTAETRPLSSKVTSVMVRLFLLGWQEWPTFIDDLIQQAKNDQDICDAVVKAMDMLMDDMMEGALSQKNPELKRPDGWSQQRQGFVQSKLPDLAMLCLMIVQATTTSTLKEPLLKHTLRLLDKLIRLMEPVGGLPEQTLSVLLELVRSNTYRDLVLKVLGTVCQYINTPGLARAILDAVCGYLPTNVDLTIERAKLVELKNSKELELFDSSMRNLAALLHRILAGILSVAGQQELAAQCFAYVLQLSMLQEKDTWASCLQSWVLYFKQPSLQLLGLDRLVEPLVWRCVKPCELLGPSEDKQEAGDYQMLVGALSASYLALFEHTIWTTIQSHIYSKFNRRKFDGACYCLCYISSRYGQESRDLLTNYLKLLLNLSESIAAQHRRLVVDHVLNVISFYTFLLRGNPFLAEVAEKKFVENIPHSLPAILNAARTYSFSSQMLQQLELKTISIQTQQSGFQGTIKSIWQVLLSLEGRKFDAREAALTTDKAHILSYVLRNFAGLELYGLAFKINWKAMEVVYSKNTELMQAIRLQQGEQALKYASNSAHTRAQTCLIKLCCLYCRLYREAGVSPLLDQQFVGLANALMAGCSHQQTEQLQRLLS